MESLKQRLTRSALLDSVPGLTHGFTNKHVTREELLALDASAAIARQVHGDALIWADRPENRSREADGVATFTPGLTVGASSADCTPVLTVALDGKGGPVAVMAVHAGWRGTAKGIAGKTLREFIGAVGERCPGARFLCAIGPCIGPRSFEVGQEVVDAFPGAEERGLARFLRLEDGRRKYLFDLPGENRRQLEEAQKDLRADVRIDVVGHCTVERVADYPSYRRDREKAGRILSFLRMD